MTKQQVDGTIGRWGNGLALRIQQRIAAAAGMGEGSAVTLTAEPGKITIEAVEKQSPGIDSMLQDFATHFGIDEVTALNRIVYHAHATIFPEQHDNAAESEQDGRQVDLGPFKAIELMQPAPKGSDMKTIGDWLQKAKGQK